MKKRTALCLLLNLFLISVLAQNTNGLAKGTIVMLSDGIEISIEEIKEGDSLLAIDTENVAITVSKVISIQKENANNLHKIVIADGNELILTPTQLVLTNNGWLSFDKTASKSIEKYKDFEVNNYNVDSNIYTINPQIQIRVAPIIEISEIKGNTEIYRIELDNKHASFIANNIFVGQ